MLHREDRFEGYDGLELYEQCWLPDGKSVATVIVVHGFLEHSDRHARTARELVEQGYGVYAYDLRGHGKSAGDRVFIRSLEEHLADLEVFLQSVFRREPEKPLFIFGHSMGGAIVAKFGITRNPNVKGLALSAPAVRIGKGVFPLLRRLASAISRLLPRLRIVNLGGNFVSRDPQVVAAFRNDPLVFHGRFPVRTGAEILHTAQWLQDNAGALQLPLLILQGTGDRVVDPEGARQLHLKAGSPDKTLHLYQGLYHEVLSEPEREQVKADLLEWLAARR